MPLPRVPDPDEPVLHVHSAKGKLGPVSRRSLATEVAAGTVPTNAHVWMKGMPEWERLSAHRDALLSGFEEGQVTQIGAAPVMPPRPSQAPKVDAAPVQGGVQGTQSAPQSTQAGPAQTAPHGQTTTPAQAAPAQPTPQPASPAAPAAAQPQPSPGQAAEEAGENGTGPGFTQIAAPLARPAPKAVPLEVPEPVAAGAFDNEETAEVPTARMTREVAAGDTASGDADLVSVTSVIATDDDDAKDKVFGDLVRASWRYLGEHRHAAHIDEVFVGAVITSSLDVGYSLIDLTSDGTHHYLRFEDLKDKSRVVIRLTHLTGSLALARVLGQRMSAVVGYGERVGNFAKVWSAVQAELKSSYIQDPEPGTITVDGDVNSGYVYCQVDLYLDIEEYVARNYAVDYHKLSRHIGSTTHALRKYLRGRFA